MAVFKVMHISDLHCGSEPDADNILTALQSFRNQRISGEAVLRSVFRGISQTTYDLEIAKKAARFITARSADISLIIASGDLSASGRPDDLNVARDFFEGLPVTPEMFFVTRDARPTVAAAGLPILLIPGNHDRFRDIFGTPGGTEFDRVFQAHWPTAPSRVNRRILEDPLTGSRLGLIGADFCLWTEADARHPRIINRWGQGKAYKEVVSAMKTETQALRSSNMDIGIAWVVHFPPCATDSESHSLELLDRASVLIAARDENIKLILAGHIHVPASVQEGNTLVSCAGTAAAYPSADGYWIHMLEIGVDNSVAWLAGRTDFAWDGSDFAPHSI